MTLSVIVLFLKVRGEEGKAGHPMHAMTCTGGCLVESHISSFSHHSSHLL